MSLAERARSPLAPFSEKDFYLSEFRGRTLAFAVPADDLPPAEPLKSVLEELEANGTRAVLISTERGARDLPPGTPVLSAADPRLVGAVWRLLGGSRRVAVAVSGNFAPACREIVLLLGVSKLVWIDRGGGLERPDGTRHSFVDVEQLRELVRGGPGGEIPPRAELLREIEAALGAGLPAVNLCTAGGVADELFTYAGSGTLFTRERYVMVRRLGLDDFDAADHLIARGVAEGYLVPRSADEIERVLANCFGAFVAGDHLAGIGALLAHQTARAGEIISLYTITRFLGEGIGAHLVGHALERARALGCEFVFACTTADHVVGFFEHQGFRRVGAGEIPAEKWRDYDPARRARTRCLRRDLH